MSEYIKHLEAETDVLLLKGVAVQYADKVKRSDAKIKACRKKIEAYQAMMEDEITTGAMAREFAHAAKARYEHLTSAPMDGVGEAITAFDETTAPDVPVLTTEVPAQAAAVQEPVEPVVITPALDMGVTPQSDALVQPTNDIDLGATTDETVEVNPKSTSELSG